MVSPEEMSIPLSMLRSALTVTMALPDSRVDRLDHLRVQLQPQQLDVGVRLRQAHSVGDDRLAKVSTGKLTYDESISGRGALVHEAGRAELCLVEAAVPEDLGESALVVVVPPLLVRVDASDVDHDVEGCHCG